jgi:hypothetical protein
MEPEIKKKKGNSNYINNEEFHRLLVEYKKTEDKKLYEKIGSYFIKISTNLLNSPNFINYTQDRKDDMISDSCYYMTLYFRNFDLDKTNAFAYFSQIASNSFKQNINKTNANSDIFISLDSIQNMSRENVNDKISF